MATSHFCQGKWRSGPVSACSRHKRLDKKQTTVYDRSIESGSSPPSKSVEPTPAASESSGSSSKDT